jgi:hypothetical protein
MAMRQRKAMSVIVLIFAILTVSLIALTWYTSNITAGSAEQENIHAQSTLDDIDFRLQNSLLYLQQGFYTAIENGTAVAANMSGRKWKEGRYRYWYCQGTPQPATLTQVRNASSKYTKRDLQKRADELHGIRDGFIYRVGELGCIETGYKTPLDDPDNDHFRSAFDLEHVTVTRDDGKVNREAENVTKGRRAIYNRMWYMYSIMKKWVNNENLKDRVRDHMRTVRDDSSKVNEMCITDASQCTYPDPPFSCQFNHYSWLTQAVSDGLSEELDKLENHQDYFNENNIKCTFSFNQGQTASYPGFKVTPHTAHRAVQGSQCGCAERADIDGDGEEECIQKKYNYDCITEWYLSFNAKLDLTVTCRDQKFKQVPREQLEHLTWNIDLSYSVQENADTDGSYTQNDCQIIAEPPVSYPPLSFKACTVDRTASLCDTDVQTEQTLQTDTSPDE